MKVRVGKVDFLRWNKSIEILMMQVLWNFGCETQITTLWSMEGYQYKNPDNNAVVYAKGKPNP